MNSQPRHNAVLGHASLCERDRRVLARNAGQIAAVRHAAGSGSPLRRSSAALPADRTLWIALAALLLVWAALDATLLADGFDLRLFAIVNAGLAAAALSQLVAIRRARPPQARAEPRAGAAATLRAA